MLNTDGASVRVGRSRFMTSWIWMVQDATVRSTIGAPKVFRHVAKHDFFETGDILRSRYWNLEEPSAVPRPLALTDITVHTKSITSYDKNRNVYKWFRDNECYQSYMALEILNGTSPHAQLSTVDGYSRMAPKQLQNNVYGHGKPKESVHK